MEQRRLPLLAAPVASGRPWPRALQSLRHRQFRLLVSGQILASGGYWALAIGQGWLVLQLTDSKFILGVINACLSLPFMLVALPAGVIADRVDRRRLLMLSRLGIAVLLGFEALLVFSSLITLWWLGALSLAVACLFALDLPTRQSMIPELVEPDEITNAVAINQIAYTGSSLIGPPLAGLMVAWVGAGGAVLIGVLGNLGMVLQVRQMRLPERQPRRRDRSARAEIAQGLAYVLRSPVLQPLVILNATMVMLAFPYQSFLPALAKDVLHIEAGALGVMYAASGLGAVVGAITVASLSGLRRRGRVLLLATLLFGGLIGAVAYSGTLPVALPLLVLIGLASVVALTMINTIMVMTAPDAMRGRVMSVNVLISGLSPVGNLLLGALADAQGVPAALATGGLVVSAVALLTGVTRRTLREL